MTFGMVVDDLDDSRAWLLDALATTFPSIQLSQAANVAEAKQQINQHAQLDIALIDLGLPDGSGVEIIDHLHQRHPDCLSVVASIYDDDRHIFPALQAGAQGYLLKDQPRDEIISLIRGIHEGKPPLSPAIARKILTSFRRPTPVELPVKLTPRETEVLTLIAKGMTLPETAKLLGLTPRTVDSYVKDIYRKLNVSSRAEAALNARQMGLA